MPARAQRLVLLRQRGHEREPGRRPLLRAGRPEEAQHRVGHAGGRQRFLRERLERGTVDGRQPQRRQPTLRAGRDGRRAGRPRPSRRAASRRRRVRAAAPRRRRAARARSGSTRPRPVTASARIFTAAPPRKQRRADRLEQRPRLRRTTPRPRSRGSESQTMPPPTHRWIRPAATAKVRIVSARSRSPFERIRPERAHRGAPADRLERGDVVDGGDLRSAGDRAAGEGRGEQLGERRVLAQRPLHRRDEMRRPPPARRAAISSGQRTLPGSQTRERSLRSRSTIITFSAASFGRDQLGRAADRARPLDRGRPGAAPAPR